MTAYENRCVGCRDTGLPCLGASCSLQHVSVVYCDRCGEELSGDIYDCGGEELCEDCLLEAFRRV